MNVFTKVIGCTQEDMVTVNMHDNLPFFLICIFWINPISKNATKPEM